MELSTRFFSSLTPEEHRQLTLNEIEDASIETLCRRMSEIANDQVSKLPHGKTKDPDSVIEAVVDNTYHHSDCADLFNSIMEKQYENPRICEIMESLEWVMLDYCREKI